MTLTAQIVGVAGQVVDCSARPFKLAPDPGFFGVGPVSVGSIESGGLKAGSFAGPARHLDRPLRWSILIEGSSADEVYGRIEELGKAISPVGNGERSVACRLVVSRDAGTRYITARYSSGLETAPVVDVDTRRARVDLIFRASDPHWQQMDATEIELDFPITGTGLTFTSFDDSSIAFSDPSTPFNGYTPTAEDGLITLNMENPGDVEAWPRWEVDGAFSAVEIAHLGTGETLRFDPAASIVSGETLVIDTNERAPSVRVDDVNRYVDLEAGSALFSLRPGRNIIAVQVTGNDTDTRFRAIYRGRYSTC